MAIGRYIIYGAGGVGASLGAQLHEAGREVVLIARGPHLAAIRERGLDYRTPLGARRLELAAVAHPREIEWRDADIAVLAMKTQDSLDALTQLQQLGLADTPVLCAQNGVHNERVALRRFRNVYGLTVWIPASFAEPGVVLNYATGAPIEMGRIPDGIDGCVRRVVKDLNDAGFDAVARDHVFDWKYTKLLTNIQTTVDAICGSREGLGDVCSMLKEEAEACYAAAAIRIVPHPEHVERLKVAALAMGKVDGQARAGGSSSQSLSRGVGSIETDYINGEIVLLGRQYGVATPANETVQTTANWLASQGTKAEPLSGDDLRQKIERASGPT